MYDESGQSYLEARESEIKISKYEIKDLAGNVRFELITGEETGGRIRSLKLKTSSGEIDVLKQVGISANEFSIVVVDKEFGFDCLRKEVFIPKPQTLIAFVGALHEFGHLVQNQEPGYKKVKEARIAIDHSRPWIFQFDKLFRFLKASELSEGISDATAQRLNAISEERSFLDQENEELRKNTQEAIIQFENGFENFIRHRFAGEGVNEASTRAYADLNDPRNDQLYIQRFHDSLCRVLKESGIWNETVSAEISAQYDERFLRLNENLKRIRVGEDRLNQLDNDFDSLFNPYIDRVNLAMELFETTKERDATRRAFVWLRKFEKLVKTKLLFDFTIEEIRQTVFEPTAVNNSEEIIKRIQEKHPDGIISAPEAMNFALISHCSENATARQLRKRVVELKK
ncbi:MAG: hypothetical protein V1664_01520 [Candidatus Uhrbacteria bacterium]